LLFFFFFQAEDGIRDLIVTGVQTCALPISESEFSKSQNCCPDSVRQSSGPACRLQYRAEQWERVPVPPSGHGELIPHLSCSRSSCQQMLNLTQKVTVTNQAGSSRFGI